MSLLNLNTEPPSGVSRTNMNLSDMYAGRSSRTYAIPYFNRDTGKMEINELDPMEYINSILSDRGRDNQRLSFIDKVGARDYGIYSREKLNNLPADRRQALVAKAAENYIQALGGRMTYGDYMNLSEKEKQEMLTNPRNAIIEGLGRLNSEWSVREGKRLGGSRVNYGGKNLMLDVAKAIDKLGINKGLAGAIKRSGVTMFNNSTDEMIDKLINHEKYGMGVENFERVLKKVPKLKMYIDLVRNAREDKPSNSTMLDTEVKLY